MQANTLDSICARAAAARPILAQLLASADVQAAAAALGVSPHRLAAAATQTAEIFERVCPGASALYDHLHPMVSPLPSFAALGHQMAQSCGCGDPSTGTPSPGQYPPPTPGGYPSPTPGYPSPTPGFPGGPDGGWGCASPTGIKIQPDFNCRPANPDLLPCQVAKTRKNQRLVTVKTTASPGVLAAGTTLAILLPAVGVSAGICIDYVAMAIQAEAGEPVAVQLDWVALQSEGLVKNPLGEGIHVWSDYEPARPGQIESTLYRCPCANLCGCQNADGKVRVLIQLPVATITTDTIHVTLWGYRQTWGIACGPCDKICEQCALVELTAVEKDGDMDNSLYVVTGGI